MVWTKLSDDFLERSPMLDVSRDARLLHVELYLYSNRLLLDGVIPKKSLRRTTDADDPDELILELITEGALSETADAYVLPWDDQMDRAEVEERKAATNLRQKRSRQHRDGVHTLCLPTNCNVTRDKQRESRCESHSPDLPVPPVLPDPTEGRGSGRTQHHPYAPDDSNLSCEHCNLPEGNPVHQPRPDRAKRQGRT